jgi:hypothetical protein
VHEKKSITSILGKLLYFILDLDISHITWFEQLIEKDTCLSIMYYTLHFPAYNHG